MRSSASIKIDAKPDGHAKRRHAGGDDREDEYSEHGEPPQRHAPRLRHQSTGTALWLSLPCHAGAKLSLRAGAFNQGRDALFRIGARRLISPYRCEAHAAIEYAASNPGRYGQIYLKPSGALKQPTDSGNSVLGSHSVARGKKIAKAIVAKKIA